MFNDESYGNPEEDFDIPMIPQFVPRFEFGDLIPGHLSDDEKEKMKSDLISSYKEAHNIILPYPDDDLGRLVINTLLHEKWYMRSKEGIVKELGITSEQFEEVYNNNYTEILINNQGKYYLRARMLGIPVEVIRAIFNIVR